MPGQQPGPPQGHYGQPPPHSAGPPHTPVYGPAFYPPEQSGYGQHRRKPVRAAQACDSCRQRKAKCDEGRPICEHCKSNGLNCSYRDVQPPKQEKQAIQIYEKLEIMSDTLIKILEKSDQNSSRLDAHGRQLEQLQTLLPGDQRELFRYPKVEAPSMSSSTSFVKQEQRPPSAVRQNTRALQSQPQHLLEMLDEDSNTHEFALPPKHFTAAQNLMEWPAVKQLLPDHISQKPTYVLDLESNRGLLRLYGCGEGEDANDGREGPASPANSHTSSSEGRQDDEHSIPSPNGVWGSGQLPPRSSGGILANKDHPGGVSPHGGLILDAHVVDQYFKSYMANIHILHPFLEARVLRDMVTFFKRRYSWDFVPLTSRNASTGKRKREADESPGSFEHPPSGMPARMQRRNPVERVDIEHSITNAIVLLVMALGKICAHKDPLPGCAQTTSISTSTPHNHFSDGLMVVSSSVPGSPAQGRNAKLGEVPATIASPADPRGKNMDVIPGLAYFAQGADILGELPGGSSVSHVQANILAGLYMGQLARILPAHYYFSNASRGCIVLIESTKYKDKEHMKQAERNLINFAFWTCLQLESDILAEVELPPSGITRYEGQMHQELPSRVTLDPIQESSDMEAALRFYSYQVSLRRELNRVHKALYVDKALDGFDLPTRTVQRVLEENLESWRSSLGAFNWEDAHHRSHDINVARMRAKYYGAKYIIHRPALAFALYHLSGSTPKNRPSESPMGASSSQQPSPAMQQPASDSRYPRAGSEMKPPSKVQDLPSWIKESAKTCIEAAICSTTVFDSVPDRLIITNIFGTAHAQFGNMLVLAATFKSDLGYMVKEADLVHLLNRTIDFLKFSEAISPTLAQDARVLSWIRSKIFPADENADYSMSTSSSFAT
jgi:hypothetical protein